MSATYNRIVIASLIGTAITLGPVGVAQTQNTTAKRKPLPDSRIELPDFFGLYAVQNSGQTVVLDNPVERLDDKPSVTLPADVEFIIYGQGIDHSTLHLLAIPPAQPQKKESNENKPFSWDDWMQQTQVDGPQNFMAAMTGVPRDSRELKLLIKPVNNQPQMLRLIPSITLPGGVYQIGTPEKTWYRFSSDGTSSTAPIQQADASADRPLGEPDMKMSAPDNQANLGIPTDYGVYLVEDSKTSELPPSDVQVVFGLQPGGRGNRGFAVDGLSGNPSLQTADHNAALIIYLPNKSVGALQMGKLELMRSLQASQFNIIRTAPQFFRNVYGKNPNETVPVNLWRPAQKVQMKVEPMSGQRDMYRIRPATPLNAGRYAVWFDKTLRESDVVFSATPGENNEGAYWFEVQ